MLELPHVLVGVAIASVVHQPVLSFPLALASHFVFDYFPHWDPPLKKQRKKSGRILPETLTLLLIDSLSALIIGSHFALISLPNITQSLNIFICSFLACLPDLFGIPELLLGKPVKIVHQLLGWQDKYHHNLPPLPGLLTQLIVSVASLLVIMR